MKINNLGPSGLNPYKRQQNKLDNMSGNARRTEDKVEISSAAKEMQQGNQLQIDRQAKVDQLKLDVQTGNYKVDPQKVAKSILDFYSKK
ncbi:flagellar biosynthesis anti-sigma factor FlgM [Neobacillus sp. D3-1R]|uniref:flagellar biosynthesis anti-sigma factor FlgM n=1 Tax=Neobacillus sp. D3-1R TaxID=3445778 RepID=UPI003F9FFF4F